MVVVMGAAGDCVRRHLAVHVEVSEARPGGTSPKKRKTCNITRLVLGKELQDRPKNGQIHHLLSSSEFKFVCFD